MNNETKTRWFTQPNGNRVKLTYPIALESEWQQAKRNDEVAQQRYTAAARDCTNNSASYTRLSLSLARKQQELYRARSNIARIDRLRSASCQARQWRQTYAARTAQQLRCREQQFKWRLNNLGLTLQPDGFSYK